MQFSIKSLFINVAVTGALLCASITAIAQQIAAPVKEKAHQATLTGIYTHKAEEPLIAKNILHHRFTKEAVMQPKQNAYAVKDSAQPFPRLGNTFNYLVSTHRKFGIFEMGPWYKWVSRNQLEGFRTRIDLGTNEQFSKHLHLHTYFAFGTKDTKLKGTIDAHYKFAKGWSSSVVYTHDIDNGRLHDGEFEQATDNFLTQFVKRDNHRQKFMAVDARKLAVTKSWQDDFAATAGVSCISYKTFNPFLAQKEMINSAEATNVINSEASLKLQYSPNENGWNKWTTQPVFEVQYATEVPGVLKHTYNYQKLTASIKQHFMVDGIGQFDYNLYGGKIFGKSLPFMLLETHPGAEMRCYSLNMFSLMNRFEYFSDTYAGLNMEHNFGNRIFNLMPFMRKTHMRQFWNVKTVYGTTSADNKAFNNANFGNYHAQSLNGHFYTEIGTGVENIFRFFRIDGVWRLSPKSPVANLCAIHQHFGVLGSFHLTF